jgi:hypothetical protein
VRWRHHGSAVLSDCGSYCAEVYSPGVAPERREHSFQPGKLAVGQVGEDAGRHAAPARMAWTI